MNEVILQAHDLFKTAGFDYAVCGGFGIDMFAGKELRSHGDFDILVFKEDKHRAVQLMMDKGWPIYGRFMEEGKPATQYLFYKISNITDNFWDDCINMWTIKPNCLPEMYKFDRLQGDIYSYKPHKWHVQNFEFIELEFDTREGNDYVVRENPRITRPLDKAILYRDGIPYLAPEIILFYKSDKYSSESPYAKPRTESDFKAIMPILPEESKKWLLDAIDATYPDGYEWLDGLL
ncbi:MAG: hypothetical protein FWC91_01295 [Defluviitaleaceae bacterium]|nr:hypothetical protein [Defluviitaleaceae bacterium]